MFELSDFYEYCDNNSVDIIPYDNAPSKGTTVRDNDQYAIFLDFTKIHTTKDLRGICFHELGHAATGALHKVSSPYELVERSEYRANRWAAQHFLRESDFREAFSYGCKEIWELSEYFELPEEDIKNALSYWTERRGIIFDSCSTDCVGFE